MANNFKVFAENKQSSGTSTVLTDTEWSNDNERKDGSIPNSLIRSKLNNTALREATLCCAALMKSLEELDTRSGSVTYSFLDTLEDFSTKMKAVLKNITKDYTDNSIADKSVRYDTTQSLTDAQKEQARTNIGASDGNYTDASNKPKLNTTTTTSQTTSADETIDGTINLHKISKTGSYNDLVDKPNTPVYNSVGVRDELNLDNVAATIYGNRTKVRMLCSDLQVSTNFTNGTVYSLVGLFTVANNALPKDSSDSNSNLSLSNTSGSFLIDTEDDMHSAKFLFEDGNCKVTYQTIIDDIPSEEEVFYVVDCLRKANKLSTTRCSISNNIATITSFGLYSVRMNIGGIGYSTTIYILDSNKTVYSFSVDANTNVLFRFENSQLKCPTSINGAAITFNDCILLMKK